MVGVFSEGGSGSVVCVEASTLTQKGGETGAVSHPFFFAVAMRACTFAGSQSTQTPLTPLVKDRVSNRWGTYAEGEAAWVLSLIHI